MQRVDQGRHGQGRGRPVSLPRRLPVSIIPGSPSSRLHNDVPSDHLRGVLRQYELVEKVRSYDPDADEGLINRAYVFSMKAHGGQQRASGDPYFSHPIEVAGLLAQMKLDTASIITGLLHDTVEDTVATLDDIEHSFGPDI